jgi:murein DD-endopeptidase MepM/ murein hydrolase activator NlpD
MTLPHEPSRLPLPIRRLFHAWRWGIPVALLLGGIAIGHPAAAQTKPPDVAPGPRTFFPMAVVNSSTAQAEDDWDPEQGSRPYVLKEGDTLATLAIDLGRDVDVMACVTPSGVDPVDELRPGQTIFVPGPRYLCYTVKQGDTLAQIAEAYQVSTVSITEITWNRLENADEPVEAGRRLLIFDGVRPEQTPVRDPAAMPIPPAQPAAAQAVPPAEWLRYGDGHFIWPVAGRISQGYSSRHRGIDIAVPWGTPVLAADNGVVVKSGYSTTGYGGRVIIDHNIDYVTLYAHLSQAFVREGDIVRKGEIIGLVGSTGNSTGPHLHLELRDFGYLVDPRSLLPK